MQAAAPSRDVDPLEMIRAVTQCAYELAMAAGEIAKRAMHDTKLFLAATDAFHRLSFAMRMGLRLSHGGLAKLAARTEKAAEAPETERPEIERPERTDARERLETERDRDYEPVSLPRFLKSLGLVAKRAETLRDHLPPHIRDTTLPRLRTLLQQATPDGAVQPASAASAVAILARPPSAPAARSRLLTSTVTPSVPPLRPTTRPRRPSG